MAAEERETPVSRVNRLEFRMPGVDTLRVLLPVPRAYTVFSSSLFLVYCFTGLILAGTILLMLPVSSASGQFTPVIDALFTATSAVSITGLVVVDTGTYWSFFGQAVLLVLFQTGGLGFIIGATLLLLAIGGRFGLREKLLITESMGLDRLSGVGGIIFRVALYTVVIESIGIVVFYLRLAATDFSGPVLWTAVFHAVSAFNNSGMDIFGNFASLTGFQADALIILGTAALIVLGGIGYLVVEDIIKSRGFARLSLESKIVLATSAVLLAAGTLFFLVAEFAAPDTLGGMPFPRKVMLAFFQATTPRTAGFTAVDIEALKQGSVFFTILLMLVGGASGSVAGGIKVNTLGVLAITAVSLMRGRGRVEAFDRELPQQNVFRASVLVLLYLAFGSVVVLVLSVTESFPFEKIVFETFSAMGTVGLTTGITPDLSPASRLLLTVTMLTGRLGALVFIAMLAQREQPDNRNFPHENVRIG